MICRLCLNNDFNEFVLIFEDNHSAVAKKIAKYLQIELLAEDTVSNKICKSCWKHLEDFHSFWLLIEEKQKSLLINLEEYKFSPFNAIDNADEPLITLNNSDIKDESLDEHEIDMLLIEQQPLKTNANVSTNEVLEEIADVPEIRKNEDAVIQTTKSALNTSKQREVNAKAVKRTRRNCALKTTSEESEEKNAKLTRGSRFSSVIAQYDAYIAEYGSLSCCLCKQSLQNFNELKKHFRKEHKCRGYVLCCNNRYAKRSQYVDHLKVHNDPEFFKCKECDKQLANRNSYQNHMASCHPAEEELKFPCSFCQKKFARQYILDYHLATHQADEKQQSCEICQKTYRSLTEMKRHQQRVHFNTLKIICDICGKHFKSKQSFQKHSEVMHQMIERPEAECKMCGKWLKDDRSLFKHMYKHRDETSGKEFVCSKCGVVKKTRSNLQSHMRYHHSETKHKCTLCEKPFKRLRCLEEHMATHTGETLYTCNFCPQTFRSHANMHNHKKKLHPNEWVRKFSQPRKQTADKSHKAKDYDNDALN